MNVNYIRFFVYYNTFVIILDSIKNRQLFLFVCYCYYKPMPDIKMRNYPNLQTLSKDREIIIQK